MKKILLAGAACAALAVAPAMAAGLRTSNSFTVSLNVQPSCQAIQSIPDVVFPAMPATFTSPNPNDQSVFVQVQCTGPYSVTFNSTNNPVVAGTRTMKDAGNTATIPYQIIGCTVPNGNGGCTTTGAIGDSSGGSPAPGSPNQPSQPFVFHISGAATGTVSPNVTYSDSVTMQVTF